MKPAVIDAEQRVKLPGAVPEQRFWVIQDEHGYRLNRIDEPHNDQRIRREDVLKAIRECQLTFHRDWQEMRRETREL